MITQRKPEKWDILADQKIRKKAVPRPFSHLMKLFAADTPKIKFINAIRSLEQNNDSSIVNLNCTQLHDKFWKTQIWRSKTHCHNHSALK